LFSADSCGLRSKPEPD